MRRPRPRPRLNSGGWLHTEHHVKRQCNQHRLEQCTDTCSHHGWQAGLDLHAKQEHNNTIKNNPACLCLCVFEQAAYGLWAQ